MTDSRNGSSAGSDSAKLVAALQMIALSSKDGASIEIAKAAIADDTGHIDWDIMAEQRLEQRPRTPAQAVGMLGRENDAFHRTLRKYPDAFEALHSFWNDAFASQPSPAATVEMDEEDDASYERGFKAGYEVATGQKGPLPQSSAGNAIDRQAIIDAIEANMETVIIFPGGPVHDASKAADAVLRLIAAQPQSSGMWQPIETAPQDGSYVLLFNALGNHAVSRWGMRYLGDPGPEAWVCDGKYIPNPTHWCPLTRPHGGGK